MSSTFILSLLLSSFIFNSLILCCPFPSLFFFSYLLCSPPLSPLAFCPFILSHLCCSSSSVLFSFPLLSSSCRLLRCLFVFSGSVKPNLFVSSPVFVCRFSFSNPTFLPRLCSSSLIFCTPMLLPSVLLSSYLLVYSHFPLFPFLCFPCFPSSIFGIQISFFVLLT